MRGFGIQNAQGRDEFVAAVFLIERYRLPRCRDAAEFLDVLLQFRMATGATISSADFLTNLLDGSQFHPGDDLNHIGLGDAQATTNDLCRASLAII